MVSIAITGTGSFANGSIMLTCNDPDYYCEQANAIGGACGNANKANGESVNIYAFSVTNYNQFKITYMQDITVEVIGISFIYHTK